MTVAARTIARLAEGGLAVFLFHGIVREPAPALRNGSGKHLPEALFRRIAQGLAERGRALSMDEVVEHVRCRRPFPPRAFALTFDDGFENNASVAAPTLRALGLPATFYLTTGFVEGNRMSWIDRIEHCLQNTPEGRLVLPWFEGPRAFCDEGGKHAILGTIRRRAKADPAVDGDALADSIFAQCGVAAVASRDDPLDRKMSWAQVRGLAGDPLFAVGGHSHAHRVLSFLGPEALEAEIAGSLALLRERAGVEARHYSYPEGLAWCYSGEVIAALKRHGIVCCPTAIDGLNTLDDDLFHLKRISVAAA